MIDPASFVMGALLYASVSLGVEYYSLSKKLERYKEAWGKKE